jgi:hypothetical protein
VSGHYRKVLDFDLGAVLSVDFTTLRGKVVGYSILLLLPTAEGTETIRVFDSAHGYNEMHRYTSVAGKQDGKEFHSGTLAEGMRAAIDAITRTHLEMIEGWRER